jgi:hypothetical protein
MAGVWRNFGEAARRNSGLYERLSRECLSLQHIAFFLENGSKNKMRAKKNRR